MDGILQNGTIPEMIPCTMEQPVLLFPVRHHSPVCSYQLVRTIEVYQPDIILIEGPENANALIPILTDEDTALPAAIYYFYKDTAKLVSDEGEDYHCYYPFLYASPEYNAMVQAKKRGIPAKFIDLPYSAILMHTKGDRGLRTEQEKHSYADDSHLVQSRFYAKLCEKTGLRSFEEFWEKYFEIAGIRKTPEEFLRQMHTYCILTRRETPQAELEADGTLAREQCMASRIQEAMRSYGKILVVTGGFHSAGLYALLQDVDVKPPKLRDFPDDVQNCYPMAYSYTAADALRGYASGMQHPEFYDTLCRALLSGAQPEGIYRAQTLDLLARTAKEAAKKDVPISTADVTAAYSMMEGLAALRGAQECGMYELYDAVTACMIKGERTTATALPLDILGTLATGESVGRIGDRSHVPPLIADFEAQCEAFRLKSRSAVPQEAELALFQKGRGMEESRFFHRMQFLGTEFAERLKGPDLHAGKDRSRVREVWRYRRTPHVDAVLIDHTTDGVTLAEACRTLAGKALRRERRCETAAKIAVDCFLMGITLPPEDAALMEQILVGDGDFFSIGKGLYYFDMLHSLRRLYDFSDDAAVRCIALCFGKLITLLPTMGDVPPERAQECITIFRVLYGVTGRVLPERQEEFRLALLTLTERAEKEPSVFGAASGLLYAMDGAFRTQAESAMCGYLRGSLPMQKQGALFLKGLFETARDIALTDESFLRMTDVLITGMEISDFLEILPSLRLAFSYFTPAEIQQTAASAAALYAASAEDITKKRAVDEELYLFGAQLDREVCGICKEGGCA